MIEITPEIQQLVDEQLANGGYASPNEVLLAALQLLREREEAEEANYERFRAQLQERIAEEERGEVITLETKEELAEFFDSLGRKAEASQPATRREE